ncbi:MAG: hypothetical protein HYS22_01330 [Deltaproteobacteria bacterium]|nr:hypothetical protein [Deltaproteobacteria bacterium]
MLVRVLFLIFAVMIVLPGLGFAGSDLLPDRFNGPLVYETSLGVGLIKGYDFFEGEEFKRAITSLPGAGLICSYGTRAAQPGNRPLTYPTLLPRPRWKRSIFCLNIPF